MITTTCSKFIELNGKHYNLSLLTFYYHDKDLLTMKFQGDDQLYVVEDPNQSWYRKLINSTH